MIQDETVFKRWNVSYTLKSKMLVFGLLALAVHMDSMHFNPFPICEESFAWDEETAFRCNQVWKINSILYTSFVEVTKDKYVVAVLARSLPLIIVDENNANSKYIFQVNRLIINILRAVRILLISCHPSPKTSS